MPKVVSEKLESGHRPEEGLKFKLACQRSSGVEQRFRKPPVVGSNPTAG